MIHIKNLTKEYKQYSAHHSTLKAAFLNFRFKIHNRKKDAKDPLYAIHDLTLDIETSEVFCITNGKDFVKDINIALGMHGNGKSEAKLHP